MAGLVTAVVNVLLRLKSKTKGSLGVLGVFWSRLASGKKETVKKGWSTHGGLDMIGSRRGRAVVGSWSVGDKVVGRGG